MNLKDLKCYAIKDLKVRFKVSEDSRFLKAKEILKNKEFKKLDDDSYEIRGHKVSLTNCDCLDFKLRKMTCKHMICVQLLKQDSLIGIKYEQIEDALSFSQKYGEPLLDNLKATQKVIEERNRLIWL